MIKIIKLISTTVILVLIVFNFKANAENESEELNNTLEQIQKDLKTLEKAVYSDENISLSNNSFDQNSEDVLTRHLFKFSEIEKQFQDLTNKFEEINFKLDKLSNRVSKVQADNQIRFQQLEGSAVISNNNNQNKITELTNNEKENVLPGSSQPQDLGSISYKDTETNLTTQQTQSIETTSTIVTEEFRSEEKLLPNETPEKQYEFATSFLKVGDYNMAERAFKEFVDENSNHKLAVMLNIGMQKLSNKTIIY